MCRPVVVTDSTANLPPEVIEEYGIPIIPLSIHWGDEQYIEGVTIDPETFYRWLRERPELPKTSQPSVGAFTKFFQEAADAVGVDTVLGVFISGKLSGTISSAHQARESLASLRPDLHIEIWDSRSVSMGTGLQVLVAARAAREGKTLEETLTLLNRCQESLHTIFAVDSLENLYRGGRIGGAARLLGTALNLKPVLGIIDGRVEPLEKVRSRRRSLRRIVALAEERLAGERPTELGLIYTQLDDTVVWFKDLVEDRLAPGKIYTSLLTPVVGTHGGPGTIGIAFYHL